MTKLIITRIRGQVRNNGRRHRMLETLKMQKKFSTMITEDTKIMRTQLKILETDITWGEANEETVKQLEKTHPKQKIYHLNPPKGGLGRKGIKMPQTKKGAYGYRGSKINDLIKRMM